MSFIEGLTENVEVSDQLNDCDEDSVNLNDCIYKDVIIIGNGPSALSLSAFLSGYSPFYDPTTPHPNAILHEKLLAAGDRSIIDQDLEYLSDGLEGRTTHGVSLLYDTLARPDADLGDHDNISNLKWRHSPERRVDHMCVGCGPVGGSWSTFTPGLLTLSFGSWLDLPAFSFYEWLQEKEASTSGKEILSFGNQGSNFVGRVPCGLVSQYFNDYVQALGLTDKFCNNTLITKVRKISQSSDENLTNDKVTGTNVHTCAISFCSCRDQSDLYFWEIYGYHTKTNKQYKFRCKKVVLACGSSSPKRLNVPNEDAPNILHSNAHLERLILDMKASRQRCHLGFFVPSKFCDNIRKSNLPVLVVGDGLSAADTVTRLLLAEIPVIHSFRRSLQEARHSFTKFSKILYPEYHKICQLMSPGANDRLYRAYPNTEVIGFSHIPKSKCRLIPERENFGLDAPTVVKLKSILVDRNDDSIVDDLLFSKAIVSIGYRPNLKFFDDFRKRSLVGANNWKNLDSKSNPIDVDLFTKKSRGDPTIYALGPLIGDNFVRYLIGGSMAAATDLIKELNLN